MAAMVFQDMDKTLILVMAMVVIKQLADIAIDHIWCVCLVCVRELVHHILPYLRCFVTHSVT